MLNKYQSPNNSPSCSVCISFSVLASAVPPPSPPPEAHTLNASFGSGSGKTGGAEIQPEEEEAEARKGVDRLQRGNPERHGRRRRRGRCKPMDAEDCEPFTDVYWIKFAQFSNARFAKRKLDEFAFLVGKSKGSTHQATYLPNSDDIEQSSLVHVSSQWGKREFSEASTRVNPSINHVSSNKVILILLYRDYFPSPSMNETVRLVREKLDRIQSSGAHIESGQAVKKPRIDNRRRI
ncbi:hypothetical protein QJS10_CPA01g01286 [Acorus calamus]|uniref:Uncharacterized protein n=1 Tax=Acorus calamus TaxID=4465 RepID=A0AAV9FII2_ACOCL|nr:hypothetical protein QJS10_CPA01g01286 [Acorus calamus]